MRKLLFGIDCTRRCELIAGFALRFFFVVGLNEDAVCKADLLGRIAEILFHRFPPVLCSLLFTALLVQILPFRGAFTKALVKRKLL